MCWNRHVFGLRDESADSYLWIRRVGVESLFANQAALRASCLYPLPTSSTCIWSHTICYLHAPAVTPLARLLARHRTPNGDIGRLFLPATDQ